MYRVDVVNAGLDSSFYILFLSFFVYYIVASYIVEPTQQVRERVPPEYIIQLERGACTGARRDNDWAWCLMEGTSPDT